MPQPKIFTLGRLVATPGALKLLSSERMGELLRRHLNFDWGVLDTSDKRLNDEATHNGSRIFSSYWISEENHELGKVWLITESEYAENEDDIPTRQSSCFLLPDEY